MKDTTIYEKVYSRNSRSHSGCDNEEDIILGALENVCLVADKKNKDNDGKFQFYDGKSLSVITASKKFSYENYTRVVEIQTMPPASIPNPIYAILKKEGFKIRNN